MSLEDVDDRTVLEIRELLRQTRNRDAVVHVVEKRGMEPADAQELVYSIHKANLSANRKGQGRTLQNDRQRCGAGDHAVDTARGTSNQRHFDDRASGFRRWLPLGTRRLPHGQRLRS